MEKGDGKQEKEQETGYGRMEKREGRRKREK